MHCPSNLWPNPYIEKGEGEVEPLEVKEEQVKIEHSRAKKELREFESKPYPLKYNSPPFPQRVRKAKLKSQFSKILEMFKQLHMNISLIEALEQMPKYVKLLKGILSNKRKWDDHKTVMLTEECSAIL